jgi:hypothetical protein
MAPRRNGCLADIAARCNRRFAVIAAPRNRRVAHIAAPADIGIAPASVTPLPRVRRCSTHTHRMILNLRSARCHGPSALTAGLC